MSLFQSMNISSKGLAAERVRLDLVSENIANINTTRTASGGPYKRKVAIFKESLDKALAYKGNNYQGKGVEVDRIAVDNTPPLMVYDPKHPDANAEGYVAKPNINLANEMVDLISASRAYEANVTVLNTTKSIAMKTLSIGRR
ncbi:flagellar basal-body rod protein FlgC [Desulfonispora thiosulfatigenes DSM 11270]|uniref:Flagellar basal-body rod protein FlgC n=1 Tax=Desulfonispora thiosulfatigenes DSM 11270 TaxID=656914 RepID=A0A1W1UNB5_DESTI|nr:flagellar basal body rod protein FlgC [Desulfonispora thiosulfatigenes]SMB82513.1 flagellar basal-body rod protein FlgC [Desulfonispora thiosulfatigenes DSM 11270]